MALLILLKLKGASAELLESVSEIDQVGYISDSRVSRNEIFVSNSITIYNKDECGRAIRVQVDRMQEEDELLSADCTCIAGLPTVLPEFSAASSDCLDFRLCSSVNADRYRSLDMQLQLLSTSIFQMSQQFLGVSRGFVLSSEQKWELRKCIILSGILRSRESQISWL